MAAIDEYEIIGVWRQDNSADVAIVHRTCGEWIAENVYNDEYGAPLPFAEAYKALTNHSLTCHGKPQSD